MIENFFSQARKSYAEGLASLYTYERQIPEIAETKIQGLKKFYWVKSQKGLVTASPKDIVDSIIKDD